MKIIIPFPDVAYYNWQVLVQINNLKKFNYLKDTIYLVGKQPQNQLNNQIKEVLEQTGVEHYIYDDNRRKKNYAVSLKPYLMNRLFLDKPELSGETIFYIDPDLLFTKAINFGTLMTTDTWYVSDTRSYIDSKYIKSKSDKLFVEMCQIIGIDPAIVEGNDANAGGAQYFMKNLNAKYWAKVERESERMYYWLKKTESIYHPEFPIQSWTSEMWATLWNGWRANHNIKIASRFDFSWATDPIAKYDQCNLFHNAGVFDQTNLFKKTDYQKSPFNADFSHVSDQFCSIKYVEEVEDTKNNYPELTVLF